MKDRIAEILQYTLKKILDLTFIRSCMKSVFHFIPRNGIDVVAYGNSLHDADSYYLIRAFESEEQMEIVLDDFYASAGWRSGPREAIISRIELSLKSVLSLPQSVIDGLR